MLEFITPKQVSEVYSTSHSRGLISEEDTAVRFYSKDLLNNRLNHLESVFPKKVHHAIAIKTNPTKAVLREIIDRGFGLEAASIEELRWALACDLSPAKAVFDSPAKTQNEIRWCEENCSGMIVNANCLEELRRYQPNSELKLGLRINPEMDIDAPDLYNVGKARSKFGVPLSQRESIIEASLMPPYISGLHIHSGSDVGDFNTNVKAIVAIVQLAEEINHRRKELDIDQKIEFIDIGGGINAFVDDNNKNHGLEPYAQELVKQCPLIFSNYQVITEFGKFIHQDNAFVVSDVEYVLPESMEVPKTAILHVGADMFVRQVYSEASTGYELVVLQADGQLKPGDAEQVYDLAGPLCFAGDYLFKNCKMQEIECGEKLAIVRVGANTNALWSRHCSRAIPKTIFYSIESGIFTIAEERKSVFGS